MKPLTLCSHGKWYACTQLYGSQFYYYTNILLIKSFVFRTLLWKAATASVIVHTNALAAATALKFTYIRRLTMNREKPYHHWQGCNSPFSLTNNNNNMKKTLHVHRCLWFTLSSSYNRTCLLITPFRELGGPLTDVLMKWICAPRPCNCRGQGRYTRGTYSQEPGC